MDWISISSLGVAGILLLAAAYMGGRIYASIEKREAELRAVQEERARIAAERTADEFAKPRGSKSDVINRL